MGLDVLPVALVPPVEHLRRDEDRGEGRGDDADEEGEGMLRSTPPPKRNSDRAARNVVVAVMIVRGSTALIERSIISAMGIFLYLRIISRIRSSTTTVSLSE